MTSAGPATGECDKVPPEVAGNEQAGRRLEEVFLHELDDQLSSLDATFRRHAAEAAIRARQLRVVVVVPLLDIFGEERPPPVYPKSLEDANFIQEALSDSILFSQLDDSVRQTLTDAFEPISITKGSDIIHKGDKGDCFYILQS